MPSISSQLIQKPSSSAPRKSSVSAEQLLWLKLRGKRLRLYKFRREYSFGVFIIDFYSQKCKLAVEIAHDPRPDGRHDEYARRRRQYIELYDIAIMQFSPIEVCQNIENVLSRIAEVAKRRSGVRPISIDKIFASQNNPHDPLVIPL